MTANDEGVMLIEKFFSENSENISVGIANLNPKLKI